MEPVPPVSLWPDPNALGPVTDLYQLTMMAGYRAVGMDGVEASFEVFVRRLPPGRSYLVFAGLEQAVGDLLNLRFSAEQVEGLRAFPAFSGMPSAFFEGLASLRFGGDFWAIPEGTVVFPGETLARVTAPLAQAQWVETFLLASLSYTTLVASKAARIVTAARGRTLLEFGARRGHGPQAGLLAARAAYLAGFHGTSHVEAARRLGIPASGTMAHSWIQSFPTEEEAFEAYARTFPGSTTLLIDTYDTLEGARKAALVRPHVQAVRLDSGDLDALSRGVRGILDGAGRPDIRIVASGDLDEFQIDRLLAAGAPIDAFGVGTELITSRDAPALSMVYKLVESGGHGRIKLSPGKKTYPMAKQVFRRRDADGLYSGDLVARADEQHDGEPLLSPLILGGRLAAPLPTMEQIRDRCARQLAALPPRLRRLDGPADYPIAYSDILERDARALMEQGA
ncbi:Nicotinate phosphoribosyltransferase pncB2 [Aquisphaera giovannonii]|uniref:Nicotinate phosphoribosyltransferase n=1 Tax=Aquisphaera giovannonii TaxID=406548 RepID=A0A5B9VWY9_9BACT|nr:nicotinate phosphoribosyltransferase [Aquisphaera giovannonii]QEH32788.1 Nicotinate phosphoribosyltransferase pncB2 [Aquisphaera giovannonii]